MDAHVAATEIRRGIQVVEDAYGRSDVDPASASWSRVVEVDNMTTASIRRLHGRFRDGAPWSLVAKCLRPASAAPAFAFIPPEHHEQVLRDLDWLDEVRVYRGLPSPLVPGLRLPRLLAVDQEPDRITLWLEDVADAEAWTPERYRRTAARLGAATARWRAPAATRLGLGPRPLSALFFGKIVNLDLPLLASDDLWRQAPVAAVGEGHLREQLIHLADRVPTMLRALDDLDEGLCHGDASPANFLEPGDGTVVGIDWSYCHVGAVGSDLAQLLAGRFECGAADVDELPGIVDAINDGFLEGLATDAPDVDTAGVRRAWATHLAVRSVFSALIVDRPPAEEQRHVELLQRRVALARFGLDLAFSLPGV